MEQCTSAKHPELFSAAGSMSGVADMGSMITPDSKERITKLMEPFSPEGNRKKYMPLMLYWEW
jgi:S-formylglutathione hydrolase FrmB